MIEKLLTTKQESDVFDIKLKYYDEDKKFSLIKDIISFANCREHNDKYLIFGVEDKTFKIKGLSGEIPDISEIQSLLNMYIEPNVDIEIGTKIIKAKKIKYIKIKNCTNKPYIIKKSYLKNGKTELREGEIYIRKNATNSIATRNDLIQMFMERENFFAIINQVAISSKMVLLLIELKNETSQIVDVTKITFRIINNQQEFSVNKGYLYNNNQKIKSKLCIDKNNKIRVFPYSKRLEWLCFDVDDKLYEIVTKNKGVKLYLKIMDDSLLNLDVDIKYSEERK